jgi:hypothetical protein
MIIDVIKPVFLINLDNPKEITYNVNEIGNWKSIIVETYNYGFPNINENEILYKYTENRGYIMKIENDQFDSLNEKQLESLERGLSDLKNNRVMTSNKFWKELLSKKEQQELLDKAYKNYLQHYADEYNEEQKKLQNPLYWMEMEYTNIRPYPKEEFINKCKTDQEFSEKWGLKIEERELIQGERLQLLWKVCREENIPPDSKELEDFWLRYNEIMSKYNIPTQLITITYQTKTITIYE